MRIYIIVSIVLLSPIIGFSQTLEFHDEASFLNALGGVAPTKETYDECSGNLGGSFSGEDFNISHSGSGGGECSSGCANGDALSYYWANQLKLTFNSPKNAFGTFINHAGTQGAVTIT